MKMTIKTILNNVIQLEHTLSGPMMYTYTEEIISSKWTAEPDSKPRPLMKVIQPHLGDDLNPSDSTSQHEVTSDKPRDKESIQ